jgi:glycosyltransferase involved in cell wall biosynthesis
MTTTIVVPCYNEGKRLDADAFLGLLAWPGLRLLFVDDGSTDDTADRLAALSAAAPPDRVGVLDLGRNQGKAEAVRRGLREALGDPHVDVVGYLDADLATPVEEVLRLLEVMQARNAAVLLASRVSLLGREIDRRPWRHYLGRLFASAASLVLRLAVYDTQCGAKLFRRSPALEAAVAEPFLSRWIFDVELLGRLLAGARGVPPLDLALIVEEPLRRWRDVPGSKLRPGHFARAARDLAEIAVDLRRRRVASGSR